MPLTHEQIESLKNQLKEQVSHLPTNQKEEALNQIESMSPEALEALLHQSQQKEKGGSKKQESPYRMIINKEIPSTVADENEKAIAVLEIRPISQGHVIVIPKSPVKSSKDIPTEALNLAKKIAKRAIANLKAESAEIQTETKFGETIINVIPVYDAPVSLNSPRTQASPESLEPLAKKLRPEKKAKKEKPLPKIKKENDILKIKKRIA